MNKQNEILVAQTIQALAEGFSGKITYQLYEDKWKTFSFFRKPEIHHETILEIRLQEGIVEPKKSTGRPVGSVKNLMQ